MWTNYLKVALRSVRRRPIYSGINIVGLALSMAVGLLVITFIWHQFQYDQFHEHKGRIVRLLTQRHGARPATFAAAPAPLADMLEETAPEVEETVRLSRLVGTLIENDNALQIEGLFAEDSFFEVFDFELVQGNPRTALLKPRSLILTEDAAGRLFGNAGAMGKAITVEIARVGPDTSLAFTVTGVVGRPPPSHLTFEALASFSTLQALPDQRDDLKAWNILYKYPTYVLLQAGASGRSLADNFSSVVEGRYPYDGLDRDEISFRTQKLTAINPGPFYGSEVPFQMVPWVVVYALVGAGAVLLLVACFNFVGLTIARSLDRTTEIGVRKAIGARRTQVAVQFMTEALCFALVALVVGYALLAYLVPAFNELRFVRELNWQITSSLYEPGLLAICLLFSVGVGVLAGYYPALRLSSFQPTRIMRGGGPDVRGLDKLSLRRVLVVVQFALALIFVISGVQLARQYNYMAGSSFGMDTERIVNVRLQGESYAAFRQELLRYSSIEGVSASWGLPPRGWKRTTRLTSPWLTDTVPARVNVVDPHFIDNMGLRLVAGEDFASGLDRRAAKSVIINETAARQLGFAGPQDAVGKVISSGSRQPEAVRVLGVVQNFQYDDFTAPIRPLVLRHEPGPFWYANVRTAPGHYEEARAAIETSWAKLNSPHPVRHERYETQIAQNRMTMFFHDLAQVTGFIALLIIVVAGMGLLGMAAYATRTRAKEIGIRKVLGASITDVVVLLSRDFFVLVSVAVAIALPVAWYANARWLQEFAQRVDMNGGVVIGSVVSVFGIVVLTVGSQTLRAALSNPVDAIRDE